MTMFDGMLSRSHALLKISNHMLRQSEAVCKNSEDLLRASKEVLPDLDTFLEQFDRPSGKGATE